MADQPKHPRSTVATFIVVRDAEAALQFAQDVFAAELVRKPLRRANGAIWNAEVRIGESSVMFGEAETDSMHRPAFLYVTVDDADAAFAKAVQHGGQPLMEPTDQFYGARDGGVLDPAGNWWWIGTHTEDVSDEEMERRARAMEAQRAGQGR